VIHGLHSRWKRAGYVRHVVTLAGGAALAQVVPLLAAPVLTRMYTPADFGVLSMYVAWLSALAVLSTARYEMAIVLPELRRSAINLLALSLLIAAALSLLTGLLLWPAPHFWASLLHEPEVEPWLVLLPFSLFAAGAMQAWTNWNIRNERFRANASGRLAQAMAIVAVQLGFGWFHAGLGEAGLILGQFAGQLASWLAQAWRDVRERFGWRREVSREEMRQLAREYVEFPRVNAPHALAGAVQDTLTVTVLLALAGTATVGHYGLMMRVLKLPAALVGQAVAQVAYRDLAAARQRGEPLAPRLRKLLLLLLALALPAALVVLLGGETLFTLVFGKAWREAGRYAEALAPYMLFHFIASPLGMVPLVINRQRTAFVLMIVSNLLFLAALAGGLMLWHKVTCAFWLVSLAMAGFFSLYFVWLFRASR
jgi:O-antigen/teichoic acid export membrane protein